VSLKTAETVRSDAGIGTEIVVPGSVANLGGGFDTLGVAVELYLRARIVDVQDDGRTRLTVARSHPPVSGANAVERAFELAARRTGRPGPTVTIDVTSDIPMAAGLGSSAAATVAGLRVFERVTGALDDSELLRIATEVEGHADNAAPALFGGLNSVIEVEGGLPYALRWQWPPDLRLIVATPVAGLSTAKARAELPREVPRGDAIFNMQRVLGLVHALQSGQYARLREAVKDRLHQSARSSLVPLLREALDLEDPDVLGAFLSGAGPSVALLTLRDAPVAARLSAMYERAGIEATVRTLAVDEQGAKSLESGTARRSV
jgi:homoserine kinase